MKLSDYFVLVILLVAGLFLAGCGDIPTVPPPRQSPLPSSVPEVTATVPPPSSPQGYPPLTVTPVPPPPSPAPTPPDSGRVHVAGEVQLITEGRVGSPVWSPDGSKIAYIKSIRVSTAPKEIWRGELWVMNADGTSPVWVAENVYAPPTPSWSPDGQRLVYVIVNDGGADEVVITDLVWKEQEVAASGDVQGPVWLTEERIAFIRDGRLVLKDLDTGTEEVREELEFNGNWRETAFIVSPDGSRLAYMDDRQGPGGYPKGELWIVDLETMEMLPANSDQDKISLNRYYSVSWSPDSRFLAYVTGGALSKLWLVDAMTGVYDLLIEQEGVHMDCPTWSADGRVIAFNRTPTGSSTAPYEEIYLVNWDGSGLHRLTENEEMEHCPLWSPDGSMFVFTRPPSYKADELEKYIWGLLLQYD